MMRASLAALAALFIASAAFAQDLALKAGESAEVGAVYWISNCKSILKSFAGADVMSGPAGLEAKLREEPVMARRQNCPDKVPGATLVLSVGAMSAPFEGTASIRVRYNTEDGLKQSVHNVKLTVYPAK